ncbi:MAG: hypothetical protein ACQEUT_07135 [Bacillota bacterium]
MNEFIEKIKTFSTHLTNDISAMIQEHTNEKIPFSEMAVLIIGHEKTKHTTQLLLQNSYHTYELNLFPYFLKLETKGEKNDFILQLTVSSQEKKIFSYNSYDGSTLNLNPISIPKSLLQELKSPSPSRKIH